MNKKNSTEALLLKLSIYLLMTGLFSCARTINTVRKTDPKIINNAKAYIISAENSQYIKFKFGVITPFAYIVLPDDPAQRHTVIGNTDLVIKQELEKMVFMQRLERRMIFQRGLTL